MDVKLSVYAKQLPQKARERYIEKIAQISFDDPYLINPNDFDSGTDFLPKTSYPDIVNYLLFAPSPSTGEELKSYKSMDSYQHYVSGYVKSVGTKCYPAYFYTVLQSYTCYFSYVALPLASFTAKM